MAATSSVYLLCVLGGVKVLDGDITAILSAVSVVASKAVQGFLGTITHPEITGEDAERGFSVFPHSQVQTHTLPAVH